MGDADLYYEDVEIGDEVGPVVRRVTDEQVEEFVRISIGERDQGRFTDPEVARREGLPGPLVPGAMSIALFAQLLAGWSPTITFKSLDIVFRQVVQHNVPLTLKGVVTEKNLANGEPQIECDVFIENADGARLVMGKATVKVPMRS